MGGGGTEDFGAQQAAAEAKKQKARDALNLQFGVAPTTTASTPDRSKYVIPATWGVDPSTDGGSAMQLTPEGFDQAGFDAASKQYTGTNDEAAKNKAAREALYGTVRNDAFTAGTRRLDEGRDKAARDLRFTLFGSGLNGGSVDVDENANLGRTYNQGRLDLSAKADATANELRSSDEQTRLGLLQAIDSGLDQGSALSSSLNQLKVNSARAAAEGQGLALGDLFGTAGLLYSKSQAARGETDAQKYWNTNYGTPAMRRSNSSGIVSSTGGP